MLSYDSEWPKPVESARCGVTSRSQRQPVTSRQQLDAGYGVGDSLAQVKVGMKVKMSDNTDMLAAPRRFCMTGARVLQANCCDQLYAGLHISVKCTCVVTTTPSIPPILQVCKQTT